MNGWLALLQEQLDRLKVEAGKTGETLQEAKVKLDAAEKDLNASRQSAYEDSQAANKEKQEMHSTITHLQVTFACYSAPHLNVAAAALEVAMVNLVHQAARNVLLFSYQCTIVMPCPVVAALVQASSRSAQQVLLFKPSLLP